MIPRHAALMLAIATISTCVTPTRESKARLLERVPVGAKVDRTTGGFSWPNADSWTAFGDSQLEEVIRQSSVSAATPAKAALSTRPDHDLAGKGRLPAIGVEQAATHRAAQGIDDSRARREAKGRAHQLRDTVAASDHLIAVSSTAPIERLGAGSDLLGGTAIVPPANRDPAS